MSADELGCRVNDNICSVLKRADQIRRCKSIVHNQRNLMRMRDRCDLLNIHNVRVRVAERLNVDRSGVLLDCLLHLVVIEWIDESCRDTILRECMCQ